MRCLIGSHQEQSPFQGARCLFSRSSALPLLDPSLQGCVRGVKVSAESLHGLIRVTNIEPSHTCEFTHLRVCMSQVQWKMPLLVGTRGHIRGPQCSYAVHFADPVPACSCAISYLLIHMHPPPPPRCLTLPTSDLPSFNNCPPKGKRQSESLGGRP